MAVTVAGSYSSDLTPNLGTSICLGCGPKKTKKQKTKEKTTMETILTRVPGQFWCRSHQFTNIYLTFISILIILNNLVMKTFLDTWKRGSMLKTRVMESREFGSSSGSTTYSLCVPMQIT